MAILLLLLATQGARITIPLATYSLPEVAERLSTPELKIEVARSLKDRGALVGLHDRTPESALGLVCQAFDLKATELSSGHLRLIPAPEVEDRERRWRRALLDWFGKRWQSQHQIGMDLADLDTEALVAKERELAKDPKAANTQQWRNVEMMLRSGPMARAAMLLASSASASLGPELLSTGIEREEVTAQLPSNLISQVQKQAAATGSPALVNPVMIQRIFLRRPGSLQMRSGIFATETNGKWLSLPTPGAMVGITGAVRISGGIKRTLFASIADDAKALGDDAAGWEQKSRAATDSALATPALDERFEIPAYENAFSDLVQKLAQKTGRDVLMELAPIGEDMSFGKTAPDLLARTAWSVKDFIARDDSWGLESVDGALVVRNRMAFLDRAKDCPVGAIAHYVRVADGRTGFGTSPSFEALDDGPGLPRLDDLLPLVRERWAPKRSTMEWFEMEGYRGLSDTYLRSRPLVLWNGLPHEVMSLIKTKPDGDETFPLDRCSPEAIVSLTVTMSNGDSSPEWQAEIKRSLQRAEVKVRWKRKEKGEVRVAIWLRGIRNEILDQNTLSAFRVRI